MSGNLYYDFNNDNEASNYGAMFGAPINSNPGGFNPGLPAEVYANNNPYAQTAPTAPQGHPHMSVPLDHQHMSTQHAIPFRFVPHADSYHEPTQTPTPYVAPPPPNFTSPSLLRGPSSTPDTRAPHQLINPRKRLPVPEVREEQEETEDESDNGGSYDGYQYDESPPSARNSGRRGAVMTSGQEGESRGAPGVQAGHGKGRNKKAKDPKQEDFLRRNRLAASKCREKRKVWVNDLEGTWDGIRALNTSLHSDVTRLTAELADIRGQLMSHANCGDANINMWIENQAKRYVISTSEQYDRILANINSPEKTEEGGREGSTLPPLSVPEFMAIRNNTIMSSPLRTPAPMPPSTQLSPSPAFFPQFEQGLNTSPVGDEEPDFNPDDYDAFNFPPYDD